MLDLGGIGSKAEIDGRENLRGLKRMEVGSARRRHSRAMIFNLSPTNVRCSFLPGWREYALPWPDDAQRQHSHLLDEEGPMTNELIIAAVGIVVSALTYFAGVQRTKQRYEKDDSETRIQKVVDEYQRLSEPRRDSGLSALIKAGVLLVRNECEAREACHRLELRNSVSPLTPYDHELKDVDLLAFFRAIQEHRLNPLHGDCVRLAKEKLK
jgi:hypothetical protein